MKKIALFAAIAAGSLAISACGKKDDAPMAEDSAAAPVADASAAATEDAGTATDAAAASEPAKM